MVKKQISNKIALEDLLSQFEIFCGFPFAVLQSITAIFSNKRNIAMVATVNFVDPEELLIELARLISDRAKTLRSQLLSDINILFLGVPGKFFLFLYDDESQSELLVALNHLTSATEIGLTAADIEVLQKKIEELKTEGIIQQLPPIY